MTQSPQPGEILTSESVVDAWLGELEGYGLRIERLSEDLRDPIDKLKPWLVTACQVGMDAFRLAAPSVERDLGSLPATPSVPTVQADDPWAELERLAKAATPGPWSYRDMRPSTYGPAFVDAADVQSLAICGEAVGRSDTHGFCLRVDSEVRMSNAAFIAAANPATMLKLVEAARVSQAGMKAEGRNEPSPSPEPDVAGARGRIARVARGERLDRVYGAGRAAELRHSDDLRLILSTYDRQGELIESLTSNVKFEITERERIEAENDRQGEEIERLRGVRDALLQAGGANPAIGIVRFSVWNLTHLGLAFDMAASDRARQGGPDNG